MDFLLSSKGLKFVLKYQEFKYYRMKKLSLLCALICLSFFTLLAENGHEIKIKIDNYDQNEVVLGYHYNGKQLVKDTITANDQGEFVYAGEEKLEGGVYMVLLVPSNSFFEILIDENDQHFSVQSSADDLSNSLKFTNSNANDIFLQYSQFLRSKGKMVAEIKQTRDGLAEGSEKDKLTTQLEDIDKEVKAFQQDLVKKHPESLTAAIIKASWGVDIPEFTGPEDEVKQKRYRFYKSHYFDNIDFADPRLIRSPLLFKKVNSYFDNLVYKVPDSINVEIDEIILRATANKDTYQYWVTHFLNHYAKQSAEIVGMDAVYVHIAHKYYCSGKTDWIEEEQRAKICKNADDFAPILIGKQAPNVRFQKRNNEWLSVNDIKSEFTVLYFWDPDCGHCKKSIPKVVEFNDEYAAKGVTLVGICNRRKDEKKMCWDAIEERKMNNWIHVTDPFLQGKSKYNITSNPRIFVLDKDKKIISKGIGSDQLKEVLDFHLDKLEREKNAGDSK